MDGLEYIYIHVENTPFSKILKIALEAIKGQLQSAITVGLDKIVFSCNNTVLLWKFNFCLYFEMYQREANLTC